MEYDTWIVCVFIGSVILTADTGARVVAATNWTYLEIGNITAVTPSSGQYLTHVLVEGVNLFADGVYYFIQICIETN